MNQKTQVAVCLGVHMQQTRLLYPLAVVGPLNYLNCWLWNLVVSRAEQMKILTSERLPHIHCESWSSLSGLHVKYTALGFNWNLAHFMYWPPQTYNFYNVASLIRYSRLQPHWAKIQLYISYVILMVRINL